jgi:hypothetical protein
MDLAESDKFLATMPPAAYSNNILALLWRERREVRVVRLPSP